MFRSPIFVFLLALAATGLFFFEYLPPIRAVHIAYDLDLYHFPLFDYAFHSLKQGRLPQWDPTVYSGMDFLSNVQAALYYPGTWLLFLGEWGRDRLSYRALEELELLHVTLAFVLCFYWLRGKRMSSSSSSERIHMDDMAAVLGAAVYAFSGYMCLQLQHFGLIGAYAWFPLGLRAIDQAEAQNSWGPLWKLAMVSALCFLAGYPPTWLVFAVVAGVYSLTGSRGRVGNWRLAGGVVLSIAFGLVLSAIQVLPAWEATHFRRPEAQYGLGIKDPAFFLSYLIPNYFDFGLNVPVETNVGKEYLYLGAPGLFGIGWLLRRRPLRPLLPPLAVLAVSLLLVINPYNLVWNVIRHSDLLADLTRSAYFLAGVAVALAQLAAYGLDDFLRRDGRTVPGWIVRAAMLTMGAWAMLEFIRWPSADFAHGWKAAWDPLVMLLVFAFSLYVFRAQKGELRIWLAAALFVSVGVDYKVFGTSKRFNAATGEGYRYQSDTFEGMNKEAFKTVGQDAVSRVLMDQYGLFPAQLRHIGWRTPQGFDPFFSTPYRDLVSRLGTYRSDREFDIDPGNAEALKLLGVRYLVTAEAGPLYKQVFGNPKFQMVGPNDSYFKVFQYLDARPPYSWDSNGQGTLKLATWQPETRAFDVTAVQTGSLRLSEQYYPGWSVTIDGNPARVDHWEGAFQSVEVPAGHHLVEFRYRSRYWLLGAGITLACLAGLVWWARRAATLRRLTVTNV